MAQDLTTLSRVKERLGILDADITADAFLRTLITSTSTQIERWCGRSFAKAEHKQWLNGTGDERLWLPNIPVNEVVAVGVGRSAMVTIVCTDSEAASASVTLRVDEDAEELSLRTVGGTNDGVATLSFATYTTLTTLATAVGALGTGWTLTVGLDFGSWPSWWLAPVMGLTCLDTVMSLNGPGLPVSDVFLESQTQGVLYRSGKFPLGPANIFVHYDAGYDTLPTDMVAAATKCVAEAYNQIQLAGGFTSLSIDDYSISTTPAVMEKAMQAARADLWPWRRIPI